MKNKNYLIDWKVPLNEVAQDIMASANQKDVYELATWLLYYLKTHDYCIWQTYTKQDIRENTGKKTITGRDMDTYQSILEDAMMF